MNERNRIRSLDSDSENRKSAIENLKSVGIVAIALIFALCGAAARAQQTTGKIPRIGYLTTGSASDPRNVLILDTLRQGLRDLGYVEVEKHQL